MGKSNTSGITEKQLRNLIPFKKGDDPRRNMDGRPVGSVSIVEGIKKKLLEIEPENKKTYLDLFLSRYFRKAIKDGDVGLIRDMINRIDGMPIQKNELSGAVDLKGLINVNENNKLKPVADDSPQRRS